MNLSASVSFNLRRLLATTAIFGMAMAIYLAAVDPLTVPGWNFMLFCVALACAGAAMVTPWRQGAKGALLFPLVVLICFAGIILIARLGGMGLDFLFSRV